MSWQLVAVLMIAEIVSNGMLSLPSSLAVVGMVPGLIVILFLGIFATFTSWLLIQFKLRHPQGEEAPPPFSFPQTSPCVPRYLPKHIQEVETRQRT